MLVDSIRLLLSPTSNNNKKKNQRCAWLVKPFERDPKRLGTQEVSSDERWKDALKRMEHVPTAANINLLLRPAALPTRIIHDSKYDNTMAAHTLEWILQGNFSLETAPPVSPQNAENFLTIAHAAIGKCTLDMQFCFQVSNPFPHNDRGQDLYKGPFMLIEAFRATTTSKNNEHCSLMPSFLFGWLDESCTNEQQENLACRVFHHFLRQHADKLPFEMSCGAARVLRQIMTSKGWLEEVLDVQTLVFDMSVNNNNNKLSLNEIAHCLHNCGMSLASIRESARAGPINELASDLSTDMEFKSQCAFFAAALYLASSQHLQAENALFHSWRALIPLMQTKEKGGRSKNKTTAVVATVPWIENDDRLRSVAVVQTLFRAYKDALLQSFGAEMSHPELIERGQAFFIFSSLLTAANFPFDDADANNKFKLESIVENEVILKSKFLEPAQARKALAEAVSLSASAEAFRSRLSNYALPGGMESVTAKLIKLVELGMEGTSRATASTMTEDCADLATGHLEKTRSYRMCGHCRKVEKKAGDWMVCPCRKRSYCGVGCQRIDWKEGGHKHNCPYYQDVKKNKPGKGKKKASKANIHE